MNIQFRTKHITLSDKQKSYITHKLEHLRIFDKHINDSSTLVYVDIEHLSVGDNTHSIQIELRITVPHGNFNVCETGVKPEEIIDKCVDKLRHQLEKYKSKHLHTHDGKQSSEMVMEEGETFDDMPS